jgi:signal peptidase II
VSRSDETETAETLDGEALREEGSARKGLSKPALALLVLAVVVTLDLATKWWIVNNMSYHWWIVNNMSYHETIPVIGDVVRLTYTHNPGAAFGINIGEHSRIFFLVLSIVALGVLAAIYRSTPATDRLRLLAVALVGSGAIGNIVDRLRYERGVVDFLDVGIGSHRWWVFNVADSAVTVGAILLLVSFLLEEGRERSAARHAPEGASVGES